MVRRHSAPQLTQCMCTLLCEVSSQHRHSTVIITLLMKSHLLVLEQKDPLEQKKKKKSLTSTTQSAHKMHPLGINASHLQPPGSLFSDAACSFKVRVFPVWDSKLELTSHSPVLSYLLPVQTEPIFNSVYRNSLMERPICQPAHDTFMKPVHQKAYSYCFSRSIWRGTFSLSFHTLNKLRLAVCHVGAYRYFQLGIQMF